MKKSLLLCLSLLFALFPACAGGTDASGSGTAQTESGETMNITLTIGAKTFRATLEENETARAFAALFPLTLDMSELNGNEYYKYLDTSLPSKNANPKTIRAGDIKLYGTNCLVIFYKSFSTSYRYTALGAISDTAGLLDALKSSGGKVTLAIEE